MSNPWGMWLRGNDTEPFVLSRKQGWDRFVNAPRRALLPVLTRAEMGRLDAESLADYTEARMVWNANLPIVRTQQLTSAFAIIDQVMASARRDGDRARGSVVIDAKPGLGKTTIATRYGKDFHRLQYRRYGPTTIDGHQRLPVAFIPLKASITLKALNQKILNFYGHPAGTAATRFELADLAIDCVRSCETRLIVIDDVHFIDFRHRDGLTVSNHLKSLANEMAVTFIFVGVGLAEKKFFDEGMIGEEAAYAQTSRRATRCPVVPFTLGTDDGFRGWVDLLRVLESHIALADAHPGMLTDHAQLLHRRTQGYIASLTSLLDRACARAIGTGGETIDADVIGGVEMDNAAQTASPIG
ncbi:ATP-binding protein [Antrihabitans cavernicola]|uniref:AAA family ATPase n=1 Tax=Antrihabitans cavernicola TaxID=2495913 RepID=A0A5A7S3D0_9NOCA|nr:ATP-binding protein [Spelaeibacter cavernicola]KAA0015718.1 AAA family ATPase [Spelaeibacter cavernicola]